MIERIRRDPGTSLLVLALALAAAIYAATLGRGLLNYDDPWLVRDNWILQHPSWSTLHTIFFDGSRDTRIVLGAEYLPVRDVSMLVDRAIWGDWYQGYHLTNLIVYLGAIALWFAALDGFGVARKLAGIAVLVWAVHPSHAESVAWLSERKGLLSVMFAGVCALGYARFRAGRSARWLALAIVAAVCAVWSKAPAAFALAALAALELALPARRVTWRRSALGLAAIGAVAATAFVPVVLTAMDLAVVGTEATMPAGRFAMVLGTHGFDLRLATMTISNAVSYPIDTAGPSAIDLVIGAIGLVVILAVAITRRSPPELRAAATIWLFGWLPASHLILPLQLVVVADRYLLFPTLGLALAIAVGVMRLPSLRARVALVAAIAFAGTLRTLDAQTSWRDATTLWQRAVTSNPDDGNAWSMYVDALSESGHAELAAEAVTHGLAHTSAPRLIMHEALLALPFDHAKGMALMEQAARGGESHAMANLASLLFDDGKVDEALDWARRAALAAPAYVNAQRILGKVALGAHHPEEALVAFTRAYAFEPRNLGNRFNLGLALIALHRPDEARPHLEACVADPELGARAQAALASLN